MKAVHIQNFLACVFLGLGSWCVLEPGTVEQLMLRPEFLVLNETSKLLLVCFGLQAVLCGVVLLLTKLSHSAFLAIGFFGSLPFMVFNYYYYFVAQMFTDWMLLDLLGSAAMLVCGVLGYRLAKKESEQLRFGGF
ncbi:MAG: hypothetical protein HWE10_09390 [Gammaproteobacteria bacterium]|nr:hypothetical protein [Gammaproteobacteria bacterium]